MWFPNCMLRLGPKCSPARLSLFRVTPIRQQNEVKFRHVPPALLKARNQPNQGQRVSVCECLRTGALVQMRSTGRPEMGNWMPSLVKERINRKVTVAADTKAARGPTAVGVPAQCALGTASLQNGTAVRLLPSRTGKARSCQLLLPQPPTSRSCGSPPGKPDGVLHLSQQFLCLALCFILTSSPPTARDTSAIVPLTN